MRNLNEQSCSHQDEAIERQKRLSRLGADAFIADERLNEDLPSRWKELGFEDKMVMLGVGVMLFAVFIVAIVACGYFQA